MIIPDSADEGNRVQDEEATSSASTNETEVIRWTAKVRFSPAALVEALQEAPDQRDRRDDPLAPAALGVDVAQPHGQGPRRWRWAAAAPGCPRWRPPAPGAPARCAGRPARRPRPGSPGPWPPRRRARAVAGRRGEDPAGGRSGVRACSLGRVSIAPTGGLPGGGVAGAAQHDKHLLRRQAADQHAGRQPAESALAVRRSLITGEMLARRRSGRSTRSRRPAAGRAGARRRRSGTPGPAAPGCARRGRRSRAGRWPTTRSPGPAGCWPSETR